MATDSIFRSINITTEEQLERLLSALEYSETHPPKKVVMSRPVVELEGAELKEFLKYFEEDSL